MDNELATRLIKARSDKGWSQADLANESGVAAAQISRYEQGRSRPRPEVLSKLAKAMGVDFSWLSMGLFITDDPPPIDLFLNKALHTRLSEAANASGRSLHAELVSRLERSFESDRGHQSDILIEMRRTQLHLEMNSLKHELAQLYAEGKELQQLLEAAETAEEITKIEKAINEIFARKKEIDRVSADIRSRLAELDTVNTAKLS